MSMRQPTLIKLHRQTKILEISFEDGKQFNFSCEYLRVFSPSAEARGHGAGTPRTFPTDKQNVNINAIEPVGNYAVKLVFDDGHNTGLYSWPYLYELGCQYEENWQTYLNDKCRLG